jgi:hypothetical protein
MQEMFGHPLTQVSSANAVNVFVLAARPQGYEIPFYEVSYDGTPTGGRLTVTYGLTSYYVTDITAAGPGPRNPYWKVPANTSCTFTITAGGVGISSRINVTVL